MSLWALLGFGFLLGLRHALDPDHLAAVAALSSQGGRRIPAWLVGAAWGLGHAVTVLLVGAVIVVLRLQVPPRLGLALEACVGLVLIWLGLMSLARLAADAERPQFHAHRHGHPHPERPHWHIPDWKPDWLRAELLSRGNPFGRAAAVGLVHGLAGSAAVALLALAAVSDARSALLYLIVFGAGTVSGMVALTALLGLSLSWLTRRWASAETAATAGAGCLSLVFGIYLLCGTAFSR